MCIIRLAGGAVRHDGTAELRITEHIRRDTNSNTMFENVLTETPSVGSPNRRVSPATVAAEILPLYRNDILIQIQIQSSSSVSRVGHQIFRVSG